MSFIYIYIFRKRTTTATRCASARQPVARDCTTRMSRGARQLDNARLKKWKLSSYRDDDRHDSPRPVGRPGATTLYHEEANGEVMVPETCRNNLSARTAGPASPASSLKRAIGAPCLVEPSGGPVERFVVPVTLTVLFLSSLNFEAWNEQLPATGGHLGLPPLADEVLHEEGWLLATFGR